MNFTATLQAIGHGHAGPPMSVLTTFLAWLKSEDDALVAPNDHLGRHDIFNLIAPKLAPDGWKSPIHRKAAMGCAMLAMMGDESDYDWREGRDTTAGPETPDQMEAGAFQVSYDSRLLDVSLRLYLVNHQVTNAMQFQQKIKDDPAFDCGYTARLLRCDTAWDGPINRGWVADQVKPEVVAELEQALS